MAAADIYEGKVSGEAKVNNQDGNAAMIRAIRTILSDVFHRLCSWHIEKNMQRHLHYKSLDEFRSLLYYATSQVNFEQRWTAFYDKWKTDRTQEWLDMMYRKRRLWAASYLSDGFSLGMRSNQRRESLNSCLSPSPGLRYDNS